MNCPVHNSVMYKKPAKQGGATILVYTCPACDAEKQPGSLLEQLRSEYRQAVRRVEELERLLEASRERVASLGIKIQAAENIGMKSKQA